MATDQLDLIFESKKKFQNFQVYDLEKFKNFLKGQGWVSSHAVQIRFNWDARKTRMIASLSDGEIIGNSKGYHLTCEAPLEEINHAASRMISQAKQMMKRGIRIRRMAISKIAG